MFIDDLGGYDVQKSRINKCMKNLLNEMKTVQKEAFQRGYHADVWSTSQMKLSMAKGRVLPKFQAREWVPEALACDGYTGDDLDGLGAMWIHRAHANTARAGTGEFPYDGCGRFLCGMSGCNACVLMWPSGRSLELGQEARQIQEFWENLPETEFVEFFKNVKHCKLSEGAAVWVPYGWSLMVTALPVTNESGTLVEQVSFYFTMAHVNKKLWQKVDETTRQLITGHLGLIVMVVLRMIVNFVILLVCNHFMFFEGWIGNGKLVPVMSVRCHQVLLIYTYIYICVYIYMCTYMNS